MPDVGTEDIEKTAVEHSCLNTWSLAKVGIGHMGQKARIEIIAEGIEGLREVC
jgi:hypothetical protein